MNEALKSYGEILRCKKAIKKSKSDQLKIQYGKHIKREYKQLMMYLNFKHINYSDVVKEYNKRIAKDGEAS